MFINVSQFKKLLKVGTELKTTYHQQIAGRDNDNLIIYKDQDLGTRKVSIVQSNSFALETTKETGEVVDSWCEYPKAKDCKIVDGKLTIYCEDGRRSKTKSNKGKMIPILTYEFV